MPHQLTAAVLCLALTACAPLQPDHAIAALDRAGGECRGEAGPAVKQILCERGIALAEFSPGSAAYRHIDAAFAERMVIAKLYDLGKLPRADRNAQDRVISDRLRASLREDPDVAMQDPDAGRLVYEAKIGITSADKGQ